jgi:protein-S-isoprenylcysteine O-methyltransferase Ste14
MLTTIATIRYWLGVFLVVAFVPAVAYWYIIHPFAPFWRRQGVRVTYSAVMVVYAVLVLLAWFQREALVGRDLGTNRLFIAVGLACYVVNILIERACRRHLTFRMLAGIPEIEGASGPQKLLREGIYNRVRHPRYLGLLVGLTGFTILVNHVGTYVFLMIFWVLLYGVIVLEERELRERFGDAYGAYMREVPRLLPRRIG